MVNRDLLKEAIADAKAVKETAIANAKAALEETFRPHMQELLAKKLEEMDLDEDEISEEVTKMKTEVKSGNAWDTEDAIAWGKYMDSLEESDFTALGDFDSTKADKLKKVLQNDPEMMGDFKKAFKLNELNTDDVEEWNKWYQSLEEEKELDETEEKMDEVDLDELLRELESMDEEEMYEKTMDEAKEKDEKKKDLKEEEEGLLNDPKTPTAHGNVAEEEKEEASEEEEIDIENMDEDDLKKFIEDVIADMVAAGELEGNIESKEGEEEGKEGKEEVKETSLEYTKMSGQDYKDFCRENPNDPGCLSEAKEKKKMKKEMDEMKKELDEAYSALATIKSELNEVNLFNAKLLYTNKIFKAKNLTESQKVKVLAAFDKAASVKEAKLVFETLSEGFKEKKSPVNESMLRGSASKVAGIAEKKPILEVNDQFARWQTLAGIKK